MLGVEIGDGAFGDVDGGVDLRVLLEGLDRRLAEERKERQLHALASLEVALDLVAQHRDGGDIDLDDSGELS